MIAFQYAISLEMQFNIARFCVSLKACKRSDEWQN